MTSTLLPEGQDAKAGSGSPFSRSKAETVAELRRGLHYPRSIGEFQAWFRTDADCLDYLEWLRWPHGFECAKCDGVGGWRTGDRRIMCAACGHRTSVTAGTIFDKTRTLLTVWFTACWLFATAKDGILPAVHRVASLAKRVAAEHSAGGRSSPPTCRATSMSLCTASTAGAVITQFRYEFSLTELSAEPVVVRELAAGVLVAVHVPGPRYVSVTRESG